jgi:beta-glucosidase
LQFAAEPGTFQVFVGTNSDADKKLSFELIK